MQWYNAAAGGTSSQSLINPQETDLMSQLDAVTTKDNDDKNDEND